MTDILYYAEVEIAQKKDVNLKKLEELEDSIFEAQEGFAEEDLIIDEEKVVFDDEDGIILLMSEDYDNLDELKEKLTAFLKQTVDQDEFTLTLHYYKNEFLEEIEL